MYHCRKIALNCMGRLLRWPTRPLYLPFPTLEYNLQLSVRSLYQEGLSHGTIKSYLAAIRFEQIAQKLSTRL